MNESPSASGSRRACATPSNSASSCCTTNPKVELKTGRVVGLEALIRWAGPDGKLIAPGLFIPLLEETGMIVEVGTWVLDNAAKQHADWCLRGLNPPRIAVNVSPCSSGNRTSCSASKACSAGTRWPSRGSISKLPRAC